METTQPLAATIPVHCAFHEMASIHVLKPHPLNPNTHPAKQLAIYAQVIAATGWREPVTVSRRSGFIVSGHGAVEAARLIPTELIPIEYQEYASEAEEVADLLAHNRLAELSKTDADLLKLALEKTRGVGIMPVVTGYAPDFFAKLLKTIAPAPQYPIVARLNEAHHLLCIPVDSETDWQFLKNIAGVRTEASYKNATFGETHVIPFARFLSIIRENLHSIAQAGVVHDDAQAPQ